MNARREPRPFESAGVYAEPGMAWALRGVGPHLHPGSETATVMLAERAAQYGFAMGGRVLEVASALGAPARFLARRFAATVLCVDMDPHMHSAASRVNRVEGVGLRVQPVVALAERLPIAAGSLDAAWSQDAMCHMDKHSVVPEVARVLRPGAIFAFSDWIATGDLIAEDRERLLAVWGFPSLLKVTEYVAMLDASGFEMLLAEDRTRALLAGRQDGPVDQELYEYRFVQSFGDEALQAQKQRNETWGALIMGGRAGYGLFIARRRDG